MAERQQLVHVVREGESVTIKFENGNWKRSEVTISTFDGIATVEATQDGIRVQAQLLNLRRD